MLPEADGLLALIKSHPQGAGEYQLLTQIYSTLPPEQRPNIGDSLVLFREHFCLFHALYKLRDQQQLLQAGDLVISALKIQWLPYSVSSHNASESNPVVHDGLRDYYLNSENLTGTDRAAVEGLLKSFWRRLIEPADKQAALALLELAEPIDLAAIKKRYRQLLSDAHPDRGGCHERTQQVNEAMAILTRCYQ